MYYRSALRTTLIIGILVLFIASQASRALAGANANIGIGHTIYSLVIDPTTPTTLYAGANDGIFKSINGGGSWNAINTGLTATPVNILAVDPLTPTTLYAGTGESGVFKSTNSGGNWSAVNAGLINTNIRALVIDPITPTTLYVGTASGALKSTNSGGTWNTINTGLTNIYVKALAIDPLTPTTLYVGTSSDGVFKSTDGGGTWNAINNGLAETNLKTLVVDPLTPTTLYAGTDWGVFKSTNGGENWITTGMGAANMVTLVADPLTPTTLYAGVESIGAFKSTNGGTSWIVINTGLPTTYIRSLAIDPTTPTTLYAGTDYYGVFKSMDGGENWNAVNDDIVLTLTITPTHTLVPTLTITPTPTTTPTRTITRTITSTPTRAITRTITSTPTRTITSTRTLTSTLVAPGAFAKSSPANLATITTVNPTLTWGTSSAATRYEYCFDITNNNACDGTWTSTLTSTQATLSGLSDNTTFYWQVRAVNANGTTYANTGTWWNFTTPALPGAFNKISPENTTGDVSLAPTLSWETSSDVEHYEYCYDTSNDDTCNETWQNIGPNNSSELTSLSYNTTYYWQIKAVNNSGETYANDGAWWSFTTIIAPPGAFNKIYPEDTIGNATTTPTLSWETSSDVDHYEYCYDTTNDDTCNETWQNVGSDNSSQLNELSYNTTYYWQIKAVNNSGETYANDNTWWSFTTIIAPPGAFSKSSPEEATSGVAIFPTLSWEASNDVDHYEYCYDTINDNDCNTTWNNADGNNSTELSGLSNNTTYYWQVKAINIGGETYANDSVWWSFTTIIAAPQAFNKISPEDAASGMTINPVLSWEASSDADYYEYCFDFNCTTWTNVGTNTSVTLTGLSYNTTYQWQVRAMNAGGETYANDGAWWNATTKTFDKISPADAANGIEINPVLSWETSSETDQYAYCYDTTNDNYCNGTWISTGTSAQATLTGLNHNTTYYWQVKAISTNGEIHTNNGIWWSFTTVPASTASINGSVTLQGRPAKPNARWSVPLNVSLTTPGSAQPAYTFTPTTDTYGKFTLTGIIPGTYEVRVKHSHTLQRLKTVTLTSGMTAINFGTLLEGDANNDNRISTADLLILATTYGKCQGISGYDPRADFNGDTCITSRDFSLLANNYGKIGASLAADPVDEPISPEPTSAEVNISIDPIANPVRVGKTFTVTIRVQAGSASVDGIQASLDFDPTKLRVKQITGNPSLLPEVLLNTYDNTTGTLDYAAGSLSSSLTGDITLVQIEFEAIAKTDATSITFHHGFLRNTEVTFADGSILKKDTDLAISVEGSYKIYQPMLIK